MHIEVYEMGHCEWMAGHMGPWGTEKEATRDALRQYDEELSSLKSAHDLALTRLREVTKQVENLRFSVRLLLEGVGREGGAVMKEQHFTDDYETGGAALYWATANGHDEVVEILRAPVAREEE